MTAAARTQAIVSEMFPTSVQKRMFEGKEEQAAEEQLKKANPVGSKMSALLSKDRSSELETEGDLVYKTKPIADLFPSVTIMFADIAGFTAWSSTREPPQVFILLETLYHAFDGIAKKRRVFKVETIGDCYVAVCGLPEPNKHHAVVMARFARDCVNMFVELTRNLESVLGPDTGELALRAGMHSGQVTAGVLRGERARFQLFGDTMNTASRMESTGMGNRVQISTETAKLLTSAGKGTWIIPREDKVFAKGKGELDTFWLSFSFSGSTTNSSGALLAMDEVASTASAKTEDTPHTQAELTGVTATEVSQNPGSSLDSRRERLVSWNVDILLRLLKEIISWRETVGINPDPIDHMESLEQVLARKQGIVIDELREVISLPTFDSSAVSTKRANVEIAVNVAEQLRDYVRTLAAMYCDNPFHNFEHASHVTMSVVKLLSRIGSPDKSKPGELSEALATRNDHTYERISSDPLTQFAVVLAALIHDAYHPGVPNEQLVKEGSSVAAVYNNQSVAEQSSVDIGWNLLLDKRFVDLRRVIYSTEGELSRFRQLVVNSVIATDIFDKEHKELRNSRWEKAFSNVEDKTLELCQTDRDQKATIVIEHLVQASDLAHTMQHWYVYLKWNKRLFQEMHNAYLAGRSDRDPAEFWYKGELCFFDFYIIPLAEKLKECGVFGVSGEEYLNYAIQNRNEWERKGEEIVLELAQKFK